LIGGGRKAEVRAIAEKVRGKLEALRNRNVYKAKVAKPIADRIEYLDSILDRPDDDLEAVGEKLARVPRELSGERPRVAFFTFCVSAILFVGIIGTFFGLIKFIASNELRAVIDALIKQARPGAELGSIFRGFEPAFGSSLIAYVSYIFARYMRDRADEAFLSSADLFGRQVQSELVNIFYKSNVKEIVDLSPTARSDLAKIVEAIRESTAKTADLQSRYAALEGAVAQLREELAGTLERFDGSVAGLTNQVGGLSAHLDSAGKAWGAANEAWRETTTRFTDQIGGQITTFRRAIGAVETSLAKAHEDMAGAMADLMGGLNETVTATREESARLSKTLGGAGKGLEDSLGKAATTVGLSMSRAGAAFEGRMVEASDRLAEHLEKNTEGLIAHVFDSSDQAVRPFSTALEDFRAKIEAATRDVVEHLEESQRVREAVKTTLDAAGSGLTALTEAGDKLARTVEALPGNLHAAQGEIVGEVVAKQQETIDSLTNMRLELAQILRSLDEQNNLQPPGDLLSVLRDLRKATDRLADQTQSQDLAAALRELRELLAQLGPRRH
jgi:predicted  nucleic acid-binding Zn-ribbon protein